MTSKAAVNRIIETLKGIYPDGLCSLQYKKDYELLFAVRLSAQCTDERVNKVTPALYARCVDGLTVKDSTVRFVGENEAWDGSVAELEHCRRAKLDLEKLV